MSTSGTEKVALNPSGTLYVVANAPEGSATAMQLVQLSTEKNSAVEHLHLLYSAKNHSTLSFRRLVKECEDAHKGRLTCQLALEEPPLEWTEEVGPVGAEVLAKFLPPVCEGKPCGGKTATIVVTGNVHFTRGVVNFLKEKKYEEGFHIISLSD
ncbi:hypothetical protein AGDE_14760 [Angomonas deanei]|uniref:Oxidoreductase NAD-binding domain containing protein, putative n=1 Tax=Angomonas deanei TaxID=59799 RepID=A0A7G2C4B4_9TRYP|nr:hypothetical protein AGDE_14760 [Angomonas deanei]CAD2214560.1 Oxidoreductase NAD-binding domain containing protein, putative [Angomonas deanei]|eukprot:EPY20282.1 hypothetical protein AGDE_14760 [Angomonas deanei]